MRLKDTHDNQHYIKINTLRNVAGNTYYMPKNEILSGEILVKNIFKLSL